MGPAMDFTARRADCPDRCGSLAGAQTIGAIIVGKNEFENASLSDLQPAIAMDSNSARFLSAKMKRWCIFLLGGIPFLWHTLGHEPPQ